MNIKKSSKLVVISIVALTFSLALSRSEVLYNASPCIDTSVCEEKILGTKTVKWLGFPAHYDVHTTFTPNEYTHPGSENQGGDTEYSMIFINTLFWMSAQYGGVQIVSLVAKKYR